MKHIYSNFYANSFNLHFGLLLFFWSQGYEGTSISDLEAATGLNKRSLYNEFGNKEAIYSTVLKRYVNMMGAMGELLLRTPQGARNIEHFFAQ